MIDGHVVLLHLALWQCYCIGVASAPSAAAVLLHCCCIGTYRCGSVTALVLHENHHVRGCVGATRAAIAEVAWLQPPTALKLECNRGRSVFP